MTTADRKLLWCAGGLLVVLTIAALVMTPSSDLEMSTVPSTYVSTQHGTRAAFLLLRRLGATAQRWEQSPLRLDALATDAVLILAEPSVSPSHAERSALKQFVERGGRVLFCGPKVREFLPGVQLQKFRSGSGVETGTVLIGAATIGAGEIVWWETAAPLTNKELEHSSNLALFLNSVGLGSRKAIYWDEYFHGERGSLWAYVVRVPAVRWAALPFSVLTLAVLFTFSRRREPIVTLSRTSRLSPLEFVESLGNLYRRAKATSLPVEVAERELRLQLLRRLALPATISDRDLAQQAASRLGWSDEDLYDALTQARAAGSTRRWPASSAVTLVQKLQNFTSRLHLPTEKHS